MDASQFTKDSALAVSLSIQNGEWDKLDTLLDKNFTYTGDGLNLNKDEYIGFMQDMKSAFTGMKMECNWSAPMKYFFAS